MSVINLKKVRTENPNTFRRLARTHLTKDLKFVYSFTSPNTAYDVVNNSLSHGQSTGMPSRAIGPRVGAGNHLPTASYFLEQNAHAGDDATLFAVFKCPTVTGNKCVIANQNATSFVNDSFMLQLISNTEILFRRKDTGWRNISIFSSDISFAGRYLCVVGRYKRTGASTGTLNLKLRDMITGETFAATENAAAGYGVFGTAVDNIYIGALSTGTPTDFLTEDIFLAGVGARAWTHEETDNFMRNPWQIFEPRTQYISLVDAVAGASITGNVTITPSINSTMDFTLNAAIIGGISISPVITSAMAYTAGNSIAGDITVTQSINATMDFTLNASVTGDVTITPVINSGMDFTSGYSITGDVTVSQNIAAAFDFTLNAAITGDIAIAPAISSVMVFNNHDSIAGDITITPSINSSMVYTSGYAVTGDVTISVAINAGMDYTLNAALAGDVTITPAVNSSMSYTEYVAPGAAGPAINAAGQLITTRGDTGVPASVTVDRSGGISGLTVLVELRDTVDNTLYLDFDDNTFKTTGWVQKAATLSDLTSGFYATQLNLSLISNMPTSGHLSMEYSVSGSVTGIASSVITFSNALTTDEFIGLS